MAEGLGGFPLTGLGRWVGPCGWVLVRGQFEACGWDRLGLRGDGSYLVGGYW